MDVHLEILGHFYSSIFKIRCILNYACFGFAAFSFTISLGGFFRLVEAMIAPETFHPVADLQVPAIAVHIAFSALNASDKLYQINIIRI